MSLPRNVAGVARVLDCAAFGSLSFGCVLDQVVLGEGEDKDEQVRGGCAQVAFLVAKSTCCSLRAPTQVLCPEQLP